MNKDDKDNPFRATSKGMYRRTTGALIDHQEEALFAIMDFGEGREKFGKFIQDLSLKDKQMSFGLYSKDISMDVEQMKENTEAFIEATRTGQILRDSKHTASKAAQQITSEEISEFVVEGGDSATKWTDLSSIIEGVMSEVTRNPISIPPTQIYIDEGNLKVYRGIIHNVVSLAGRAGVYAALNAPSTTAVIMIKVGRYIIKISVKLFIIIIDTAIKCSQYLTYITTAIKRSIGVVGSAADKHGPTILYILSSLIDPTFKLSHEKGPEQITHEEAYYNYRIFANIFILCYHLGVEAVQKAHPGWRHDGRPPYGTFDRLRMEIMQAGINKLDLACRATTPWPSLDGEEQLFHYISSIIAYLFMKKDTSIQGVLMVGFNILSGKHEIHTQDSCPVDVSSGGTAANAARSGSYFIAPRAAKHKRPKKTKRPKKSKPKKSKKAGKSKQKKEKTYRKAKKTKKPKKSKHK
tara:strand:- start:83 stop:1477 length:1395 start_codon:yes stop_codon:yes gene_type:complete